MSLSSGLAWIASWFQSRLRTANEIQLALTRQQELETSLRISEENLTRAYKDGTLAEGKIHNLQQEVRLLQGTVEVQTSQLEEFAAWEAKLLARHEAEAAIEAARKVRALEHSTLPQEPDLI